MSIRQPEKFIKKYFKKNGIELHDSSFVLERAENAGTLVVNKPQSLRDANEKLFTAWFSEHTPDTLVTRSQE